MTESTTSCSYIPNSNNETKSTTSCSYIPNSNNEVEYTSKFVNDYKVRLKKQLDDVSEKVRESEKTYMIWKEAYAKVIGAMEVVSAMENELISIEEEISIAEDKSEAS